MQMRKKVTMTKKTKTKTKKKTKQASGTLLKFLTTKTKQSPKTYHLNNLCKIILGYTFQVFLRVFWKDNQLLKNGEILITYFKTWRTITLNEFII